MRGFVWADIDADGDPDAALIDDQNKLRVFTNERSGQFKERSLPASLQTVQAISTADVNNDGVLDLLAVEDDGRIIGLSDKNEGQQWETTQIATYRVVENYSHRRAHLQVIDLDNNGANDLLLTFSASTPGRNMPGALVWLGDESNKFGLLDKLSGPALVMEAADINGDGRLDLLGLTDEGQPIQAINHGSKNYHWQVVRPRAAQAVGDQRINPLRRRRRNRNPRRLCWCKSSLITGPQVHFGLGEQTGTDVVRVIWPNGAVRAEFEVKGRSGHRDRAAPEGLVSVPLRLQRQGDGVREGRRAVGLGDRPAHQHAGLGARSRPPRSGTRSAATNWCRTTATTTCASPRSCGRSTTTINLALMTVDHPAGTEIFVDERFVIPPAKLAITTVATPHKIARAVDDTGNDVTDIVGTLDGADSITSAAASIRA